MHVRTYNTRGYIDIIWSKSFTFIVYVLPWKLTYMITVHA